MARRNTTTARQEPVLPATSTTAVRKITNVQRKSPTGKKVCVRTTYAPSLFARKGTNHPMTVNNAFQIAQLDNIMTVPKRNVLMMMKIIAEQQGTNVWTKSKTPRLSDVKQVNVSFHNVMQDTM